MTTWRRTLGALLLGALVASGCRAPAPYDDPWHVLAPPWKPAEIAQHPSLRARLDDGATRELGPSTLETRDGADWIVPRTAPTDAIAVARVTQLEGTDPSAERQPVPKPWTPEVVESKEILWIELASGRHGFLFAPRWVADPAGDHLTSKNDPKVDLPLADVRVMDEVRAKPAGPSPQSFVGSVLAVWTGVFFVAIPIALVLIFA